MTQIPEAALTELRSRTPLFKEAAKAFYAGELAPAKYKGTSGKFGSYGERGAASSMLRLRFSGGEIPQKHIAFLSHVFSRYPIGLIHFTTGEALQIHHLCEQDLLALYEECFDAGVYCYGAGSDNPRNITASPLHGIDPHEPFDMTPYIHAAANFVVGLMPDLKLPRKFKIGFSSGHDNEGHATFKDLGFLARMDQTFDVYAGGGFGLNGSRFGILIDQGVAPCDIGYYIRGYARDVYMKYGDYEHRGMNRSRFILTKLGEDEFRKAVRDAVTKARAEGDYRLTPELTTPLSKSGADDTVLADPRIGAQKQMGLYYVEYKPLGGTPDMATFRKLLAVLLEMEGTEIRLNADETAYIINLTAAEARTIASLTAADSAVTPFEHSVSCIGAAVCQQGLRDSHGMLIRLVKLLKESGLDMTVLPKCHFSGCPSNCTIQQVAPLGFRGAAKKVDGEMKPAFLVYAGGCYDIGCGIISEPVGTITEEHLPDFMLALVKTLMDAGENFTDWYPQHKKEFTALVKAFI